MVCYYHCTNIHQLPLQVADSYSVRWCTNTELKKEGVCSESAKTKLVKPGSFMWEACIIHDQTNTSGALRFMPVRRSQGSIWRGVRSLSGKVKQLPTAVQNLGWHCMFQDFPKPMMSVVVFCIRTTSWADAWGPVTATSLQPCVQVTEHRLTADYLEEKGEG